MQKTERALLFAQLFAQTYIYEYFYPNKVLLSECFEE